MNCAAFFVYELILTNAAYWVDHMKSNKAKERAIEKFINLNKTFVNLMKLQNIKRKTIQNNPNNRLAIYKIKKSDIGKTIALIGKLQFTKRLLLEGTYYMFSKENAVAINIDKATDTVEVQISVVIRRASVN